MKYYDLKALTNYKPDIIVKTFGESNDKLLLAYLFRREQENQTDNFVFILQEFFSHYKGDRIEWLNHTIDIVYPFLELNSMLWLFDELYTYTGGEKITPVVIITRNIDKIQNRKDKKLEDVMKEIADKSDCPYAYSYLDRIRKEMNIR